MPAMAAERITSRFGPRSTAAEVIAGVSLKGKRAIVTGATTGLGIETARALAQAGAIVTLGVRDIKRGQTVAKDLRKSTSNSKVEAMELDLAHLSSVQRFAALYMQTHATLWSSTPLPLHILVNNAGVMATPQTYTPDGFELQFGTNHLGHFYLTTLLLPALRKDGARIVSLTSIGHRRSDIHYDDIHFRKRPYDKWSAYGQSKTANALFAVGATERFAKFGITANAVMPGGIMTGLQESLTKAEMQDLGWIGADGKPNPAMKSVEQGAATSVWAATAPELEKRGGLYLEDCAQALRWTEQNPWHGYKPYALDATNADRLWQVSEAMLKV